MSQPAQVVFSVSGKDHNSDGNPDLMTYQTIHANVGGGWNGSSTFNAPVAGAYFFAVSCVREASGGATADDVFILLRKNGRDVGFAWCGAGSGNRSTGVYHVAIPLRRNDRVETFANSDAGRMRLFRTYQFSGFLVR